MKKTILLLLTCALAVSVYAAGKTNSPKAAKTASAQATTPVEFLIVEASDSIAGKQEIPTTYGIARFLEGTPKVTVTSVEEVKQNPELANLDYSFLPLYLVKKTTKLRNKLEQHLQAGYVQETEHYLVFPHATRTGMYPNKIANPDVLEIFVMSQCPYGVRAENLVIEAIKAGKLPADKTIKLRYIVNYNSQTGEFQSLHGSGEWEENVRQLLIAKYYPAKLWKYLEIRNKDYRSSRWDKAMEEAGINVKKIMKKFDTEGLELLKAEAAYGEEYNISASPTLLWQGREIIDFGTVANIPGLEFMNPSHSNTPAAAVPAGSC